MRVGLVCPYNMFRGGGVQEVVLALRTELVKRSHDVKIITPWHKDCPPQPDPDFLLIGKSKDIKSPFHTATQISAEVDPDAIDLLLASEQFDILHFHEPWVPILSRQILSRSQSINVATFHAKLPETVMSRTIEKVVTPYTKSILKYLHSLTAVSDPAAEYVRSLTKVPVNIIPNGIDLVKYSPSGPRLKPKLPRKTILYVGRLEKRKGVIYLLKAYQQLCSQRTDARLIIAGDGPDRTKLEAFVTENHLPRVTFKGYVSEQMKLALLQEAALFCSPAVYGESFGIVLLEAMATGTMAVAGNNSGYESVMQGRGALSLINPLDTNEFSRRLNLLLDDRELRELWKDWASKYVKQFSYSRVADQYETLYRQAYLKKKVRER